MITLKLVFGYTKSDTLPSPLPTASTIDFNSFVSDDGEPRGGTKWTRMLNKNIIYTKLPTEEDTDGGFGYDLGFTEDTFTFSITTFDYDEMDKIFTLAKTINATNGTIHGVLLFHSKTYNVIVRTVQSTGLPGGNRCNVTLTCTVVGDF